MSRNTAAGDVVVTAIVFASAFGYFCLFHRLGWFLEDEGVLYYHYLRVYQGQVPYRDFFTGYGPIGYYVHAWAFALFGVSINAVRLLTGVVNAATAAGLYAVSRRVAARTLALLAPALFVAMQPWDIAVMVFQNSPYPSWYALAFSVWGTWALLRSLEASSTARRRLWLVITGILGGLAFFTKQNTGTFFLWAVTGFLASHPLPSNAGGEPETRGQRALRTGYLALLPLATLALVRNFIDAATLTAFVAPIAGLGIIGARQPFTRRGWWGLVADILWVAGGVVAAIVPWLVYFGRQMGLLAFLNALLFLGAEVDRNLYLPFPTPTFAVAVALALLLLWAVVLRGERRRALQPAPAARLPVLSAAAVTTLCVLAVGVWQASVVGRVGRFEYNLWQIYAFVSERIDNLAAYASLAVLGAALVMVWRRAANARARNAGYAGAANGTLLCVLWAGTCSFIGYYPRMDYAHLVGALPLLYAVGAAVLSLVQPSGAASQRRARFAFDALCIAAVVFVVGIKSAPKVYSRVMVGRTEHGLGFVATPQAFLTLPRADLYFPIYLERQRLTVEAFAELISHLRSNGDAGSPLFAFPALPMVYFLSGRDNPTRHDYFLGDNASFREQMEVVRTLEQRQVATVVVDNVPTNYFVAKSREFTRLIEDYLHQRYYLERRIGPYDVLRRYGSEPRQPASVPPVA